MLNCFHTLSRKHLVRMNMRVSEAVQTTTWHPQSVKINQKVFLLLWFSFIFLCSSSFFIVFLQLFHASGTHQVSPEQQAWLLFLSLLLRIVGGLKLFLAFFKTPNPNSATRSKFLPVAKHSCECQV